MKPFAAALALLLPLAGCGGADHATAAQEALNSGDFAAARLEAEAGLEGAGEDKALAWRLERIRLEALANEGEAEQVVASLDRLSSDYAAQINADLYAKLGNLVHKSGETLGSLDVAEAGKTAFPEKAGAFDGLIANLTAAAAGDDALTAKLRQLGYL